MSAWSALLSSAEIEARHERTEKLDPRFARTNRAWWETRTVEELRAAASGAWYANDAETYQLARSYLALRGE